MSQDEISVVSHRTARILGDARQACEFLSRVPQSHAQVSALAASLAQSGHVVVAAELERLAAAEGSYRESLRAAGTRGAVDDRGVRLGVRAVCGAVRSDPAAAAQLPGGQGGSRLAEFAGVLGLLTEVSLRRLQTSKARRADDAREIANRQARIDAAEVETRRLGDALRRQRAEQARALASIDAKTAALKAALDLSAGVSSESLKGLAGSMETRSVGVRETAGAREAQLRADLDKVQVEFKVSCDAHGEAEAGLRKKLVRARLEKETAMREYDAALGTVLAKVAAAENLDAERRALEDYAQYFARVDGERARRAEEEAEAEREFLLKVTLAKWAKEHRIKTFLMPWVARARAQILACVFFFCFCCALWAAMPAFFHPGKHALEAALTPHQPTPPHHPTQLPIQSTAPPAPPT